MKLPKLQIDWRDIAGTIGAAAVAAGVWWIFPPAGLIVAGAFCLTIAIIGAK